MSTFAPSPSDSTGRRPPAVEFSSPFSTGIQSEYVDVLAPDEGERGADLGDWRHVNGSVVMIVAILSVVFILSGLMHLFARCLGRRRRQVIALRRHSPLVSSQLHGQLQQLFYLHDAGMEQEFINTLPVFAYGCIRGLKDSADCAVCLNEFADDDRLRLLPMCSHAFHLECIDTWLLSHSTCPLCRRSLLPDNPLASSSSHLRHGELTETATATATSSSGISHSNHLPCPDDPQFTNSRSSSRIITSLHGSHHSSFRILEPLPASDHDVSISKNEINDSTQEIEELIDDETDDHAHMQTTPSPDIAPTIHVVDEHGTERVLKVELGKVAPARTASSQYSNSPKLTKNGARSYSMGSYEYIVDPTSSKLTITPTQYSTRTSKPSHRSAYSDSTPELASTPRSEESHLFWTSCGVRSPALTPIMSSDSSSTFPDPSSYSPSQGGDRWIDIDIERGEVIVVKGRLLIDIQPAHTSSPTTDLPPPKLLASTQLSSEVSFKQRSSSLGHIGIPKGFDQLANVSCFRRSSSEALAVNPRFIDFVAKDVDDGPLSYDHEIEEQGSVSRKFSLNWLKRDKGVVFSAVM